MKAIPFLWSHAKTPSLHYTPGEINSFLGAQKRPVDNANNISIDCWSEQYWITTFT